MVLLWMMLSLGACSPQARESSPALEAFSRQLACTTQPADDRVDDESKPEHQPAASPDRRPAQPPPRTAEPPEWEI